MERSKIGNFIELIPLILAILMTDGNIPDIGDSVNWHLKWKKI